MDLFPVYPLSQLLSPRQREEGGDKVPGFIWKSREDFAFKKQTLKRIPLNSGTRNMEDNAYARETWGIFSGFLIAPAGEGLTHVIPCNMKSERRPQPW